MIANGHHGSWGCALSWEKRVNRIFGDIPETPLGEDAFIPFRCALVNGLAYLPLLLGALSRPRRQRFLLVDL